ncbi:hypothetical protein H0H92_005638, partial [Tricholoma furcatifolium]
MAPGNTGGAADKRKGKDKAPKKSTRLTRQTSSALKTETTLDDTIGDNDIVDYGYSDLPDPVVGDNGVRISIMLASSSPNNLEESARPATGSTLDIPDVEYLSPDTEEALAANALAGGDTEGEDEPVQLDEALAQEGIVYAPEFASQNIAVPSTLATTTGCRADRTPATGERPVKRTRERSHQSPWHPGQSSSIFPIDRAQVVAERASANIQATPGLIEAHTHTLGAHTHAPDLHIQNAGLHNASSEAQPAPAALGTSFTLTQDQLLAIIAAAQAGTLANLANALGNAITAALTSHNPHELTSITGSHPAQVPQHDQTAQYAQSSAPPAQQHASLAIHGNHTYVPSNAAPCRALANPSTTALHAMPPAQTVLLSADDRVTPHKVQKILRSGFREHIPLHHITNKLMEEAAFQTPSTSGGIQISGQTIRLESVGLETAGERKLSPETWIKCSMNLVRAIAEHLLAGTDGRCGGPTAWVIAARFEQHFANLRSKADFISHFHIYLKYDIRIRSRWVTMSHDMDIAVWQPHILESLVLADVHRTSDAMISALSNFQNTTNTSQTSSSR